MARVESTPARTIARIKILLVVLFLWILGVYRLVSAEQLGDSATPSALIAAVNQLRVENGLNALPVHVILMQTAQQQADALMASGGAVGHTRPDGLTYTDQLILLGYPLAGDLTLGGYRAENWISAHPDMTIQDVIQAWLSDAPHTNTMLSPYYTDIGAGISVAADGTTYYVIDTAMQTASGKPQAYTPVSGMAGSMEEPVLRYIQPVILATARPDGDVIHEVLYGHALWSIAIAYGVKIEQIQRYNNLSDTTIYTGQILLVQKGATQPAPTLEATLSPTPRPTRTLAPLQTASATPGGEMGLEGEVEGVETETGSGGVPMTVILVGLLVVSMGVGGLVTWLLERRG